MSRWNQAGGEVTRTHLVAVGALMAAGVGAVLLFGLDAGTEEPPTPSREVQIVARPPAAAAPHTTTAPESSTLTAAPSDEVYTDPEQLLQAFIPAFGSFTLAANESGGGRGWINSFRPMSTVDMRSLAGDKAREVWAGAYTAGLDAVDPTIDRAQQLWDVDDYALWRVTYTHQLRSHLHPSLNGPAQQTWDLLLQRNEAGDIRVASFSRPTPSNEHPDTYTRPEVQ